MNGGELSDALVDLAHLLGYRVYHPRPGRTVDGWVTPVSYDGKGYPDLTIVGPRGIHFVEVKGTGDRVRPEQEEWIVALRKAGGSAWVCSPSTWRRGMAEAILRGQRDCLGRLVRSGVHAEAGDEETAHTDE